MNQEIEQLTGEIQNFSKLKNVKQMSLSATIGDLNDEP